MCGDKFTVNNGTPSLDNPISPDNLQLFPLSVHSNSTASIKEHSNGTREVIGNATECALLNLSQALGGGQSPNHNRLDYLPFSSATKTSRCICQTPDGKYVLFVTGAPEAILKLSSNLASNTGMTKINA